MPNPDNINNMPDRRHSSPMPDDQKAEFKELKGMIGECTRRVGVEVGRARKGHEIIIARLDKTDANIADARGNGDRRLKEHDQLFIDHAKDIERLKRNEINNSAEIKKLREGLDGVINEVGKMGHVVLTTNTVVSSLQITQGDGFIAMSKQFSVVGDAINQLRGDLKSNNAAVSRKWYSKLPLPAYGVITVAAFGVLIYWLTGDDTIVNLFKRGG
jgi:hypothetical protein